MSNVENIVIIGSGCAGWTAAIYAARANLKPLVLTGRTPGGLLTTTSIVENYPGFRDGIDGNKLMEEMREQALRFGAQVRNSSEVEKVDLSKRPFQLSADGELIESKTIIIATGAGHRKLGLESEKKLDKNGVTYCATCDGPWPRFKGKPLVVVGGGDSACEEALYLTRFASQIHLVHRRDQLRASKIMAERLLAHPKIQPIWDTTVEDILDVAKNDVTAVKLKNIKTGKESVLPCTGVFVAIGHVPSTELFKGQLQMNDAGYLIVQSPTTSASVPGIFACGDCVDHIYRQAVTAAGTGCSAAIDAERFLAAQ